MMIAASATMIIMRVAAKQFAFILLALIGIAGLFYLGNIVMMSLMVIGFITPVWLSLSLLVFVALWKPQANTN